MENIKSNPDSSAREMPSIKDMELIRKDVRQYDQEHSAENWNNIQAQCDWIEQNIKDPTQIKYELSLLQNRIDANIGVKYLKQKYQKYFTNMGLDIEAPTGSEKIDLTGEGKRKYSKGELIINVADKNNFITFLKSFNEDAITINEANFLANIARKINKQIRQNYDVAGGDERFLELAGGLKKIIAEFNRLELTEYLEGLDEIADKISGGDLLEYLKNNK